MGDAGTDRKRRRWLAAAVGVSSAVVAGRQDDEASAEPATPGDISSGQHHAVAYPEWADKPIRFMSFERNYPWASFRVAVIGDLQ